MTVELTPQRVESAAEANGRFGFAFSPRFFIALALAFVCIIPLFWSERWSAALIGWIVFVIAAWIWDAWRLPKARDLIVSRAFSGPMLLAEPAGVTLEIVSSSRLPLRVLGVDELAPTLYATVPQFRLILPARGTARHDYTIVPRKRGDAQLGSVFLHYGSGFGFAERWAVARLKQSVCVLPDIAEANRQALYLIRSRQTDMEKRRHRDPGLGREFESLREYREGDEVREICWTATARRHHLVTRTFQSERTQTVWAVLDCGRLMRAEIARSGEDFRLTKLDYAVNAALSIARVTTQRGDRFAALAYGRNIQQALTAGAGALHIRRCVDTLAHIRTESAEANHMLAARVLLQKQTRRALVVWITDFAESPATPDVVEYAIQLARRHLVLFVAVNQPDLADAAHQVAENDQQMYRAAAALGLLQRREVLLRTLRQSGVLALEMPAGGLTTAIVNEYLAIKDRNLL